MFSKQVKEQIIKSVLGEATNIEREAKVNMDVKEVYADLAEVLFDRLDWDGNGVLSPKEMDRLGYAADVELSGAEIGQAVKELKREAETVAVAIAAGNISLEESDTLFEMIDIDGDGQLTQKEIKKGLGQIKASTGLAKKAKDIFQAADASGDKKIDSAEFFTYMKTTWEKHEDTGGAAQGITVEALASWLASQSAVAEKN